MKVRFNHRVLMIVSLVLILGLLVGCRGEDELEAGEIYLEVINPEDATVELLQDGEVVESETGELFHFTDLEAGEYLLQVSKEGYQSFESDIIIADEPIVFTEINLKEKEVDELKPTDLKLEIKDINGNCIDAKAVLLEDERVVRSEQGGQVEFLEVPPGEYILNVSQDTYQPVEQELELTGEEVAKSVTLKGGKIEQEIVRSTDEQVIDIKGLKSDEEVIVAVSPLDVESTTGKKHDFTLDLVYYNYFGERERVEINDSRPDFISQSEEGVEDQIRAKEMELIEDNDYQQLEQRTTTKEYSFYETEDFYVPNLINPTDKEKSIVTAKMVGAGEHIYVFVDKRADLELNTVDRLVEEFDTNIYPTLTEKFGQPSDVDNNEKIMVLLTKFNNPNTSGFFYPDDLRRDVEETNFNDLVYLNLEKGTGRNLYPTLAHQFQHLIFYNQKLAANRQVDDIWINEGLAKLAEKLTGYIDSGQEGWSWDGGNDWVYSQSTAHPGYFMLTDEIAVIGDQLSIPYLGGVGLFTTYLYEQYGIELLTAIMTAQESPQQVIVQETGLELEQIFLNWLTTNVTDQVVRVDSSVYNYQSFDLVRKPEMLEVDDDYTGQLSIKENGVQYLRLYGQNSDLQLLLTVPEGLDVGVVTIRKERN
ncbi:carboxypeptidase-like regulatory domain-containing protein [Natroniella acetigena]|uniref:carboxypeptidase-like regulatory domain-containing protein n=1 Tax=Natroniella acetigena TaxID=52004 RepID=UPI00200AA8EA|nr:carboxypeptidase-like regulatory domain-containing protein [Natroniella acetigena]MCK8827341.1 carboxypeptidase-like regulatory domain-containing protein [Natroniella acetigena]